MKKERMLHIEWNDKEAATYYIDKDKYSKAHKKPDNKITLDAYEGIYTFDEITKEVTLNTGAEVKKINVKEWKSYLTPTP